MALPHFGGPWTQEKLGILCRYLDSYTTALKKQPFRLIYVDAFAGAGTYAEDSYADFQDLKKGSASIALEIDDKPFDQLIFVEKETKSVNSLLNLQTQYPNRTIEIVQGDANDEIPNFCNKMKNLDRAVVFLDPYATQVSWSTVEKIASTQKIDCWILFPLMAVTRMMPRRKEPDNAIAAQLDRVFGGRDYWLDTYDDSPQMSLFADSQRRERSPGSEQIAGAYKKRLSEVFHKVATRSRTLKNSSNGPLFELFFAVGNPKGAKPALRMADHILKKW